tara:strand:+ start:195 stop:938 length:744 start_codon:yes stop_codon:yes gene_type:complete
LRLFALRESGIAPFPESEPLIRGSLAHIGLAHIYARKQEVDAGRDPNIYYTPMDAILKLAEKNGGQWLTLVDLCCDMVNAHHLNWGDDNSWKVISVEEELRATLRGKWLYTQRADLIVEDKAGKVWIVDHKTAFRIASKTLSPHILDGQMLGYQMFGRARFGKDFGGVVINRITTRAPFKFDRSLLEPAPHALSTFVSNICDIEGMIENYKDRPPMDWPGVFSNMICSHKYGKCDAFEQCQWGINEA